MHPILTEVTARIQERSRPTRERYLARIDAAVSAHHTSREHLGCSNLAHTMASASQQEKNALADLKTPHIAIVTAYNDMLSAHQPYAAYPPLLKRALMDAGATAQVAGGVPAMCDGVTQSQPGMELSLFSRDVIAMATGIALSHNVFDGALYLGVCDKIVPGLLIGALTFGHLPAVFIPAGPMGSGISNTKKAQVRQEYAQGRVDKGTLLQTEAASYHSSGTCTFYGTANSNQMLMEIMGLHVPGGTFVNTNTPLREALSIFGAKQVLGHTPMRDTYLPVGRMIDERSFVNAIVGLMTTGGSTNHTLHLIAMANAAGIILNWDDFDALSSVTPLLAKMYPNGSADVNHFRDAGGMGYVIAKLLDAGLLHESVRTVMGQGLSQYAKEAKLQDGRLVFDPAVQTSRDASVLGSVEKPFADEGGLALLRGNIGRAVIKISALKPEQMTIEADAIVFESQEELKTAFNAGELERDFIAVVRHQGPRANGMPELHGLMPPLGVLQDKGFKVAIVTDGRMSGASGKVPSAIHVTPEALDGGMLARIRTGDRIRMDVAAKSLELLVDDATLTSREAATPDLSANHYGVGRELFGMMRTAAGSAEQGAGIFDPVGAERG